jgi:hypothetical protein
VDESASNDENAPFPFSPRRIAHLAAAKWFYKKMTLVKLMAGNFSLTFFSLFLVNLTKTDDR